MPPGDRSPAAEARAPGSPAALGRGAGWWWRLAFTYAVAFAAGALATQVNMPLPWMLGPFFAWAALSIIGIRPALAPMGRELGQVAIGVVVGLRFTLPILVATLSLLPEMIGATLYLLTVTTSAAFLFGWLARTDHVTSFFATAAGGVADMAHVAQRFGGEAQAVAVVHAMRLAFVVAPVPMIVFYFGEQGGAMLQTAPETGSVLLMPVALFLGYLGARALKPAPIPNPWLVGPIFVGMFLGVSGVFPVHIPGVVIALAQIALGTWLGSQFKRDQLTALPRVTISASVAAIYMVGCAAAGAWALAWLSGLPFSTGFLSLAPGAVTEMVLTAKVMNLDIEIVTAFHIMRIAIVASTVLFVFRFYMRLRGARLESGV